MSHPTNRHPVLVILQSPAQRLVQGTTVKLLRVLMAAHARLLPFGKGSLVSITAIL